MVAACGVSVDSTSTVGSTPTTGPSGAPASPFFDGETAVLEIEGESLVVAVADSSAERAQGLMAIETLGDLDGMLFIHESVGPVSYTMRNTLIPLDIWFIDEEGVIVGTSEMVPCPGSDCVSYPSPQPVLWVLETALGVFDFRVGSSVEVIAEP